MTISGMLCTSERAGRGRVFLNWYGNRLVNAISAGWKDGARPCRPFWEYVGAGPMYPTPSNTFQNYGAATACKRSKKKAPPGAFCHPHFTLTTSGPRDYFPRIGAE